MMEYMNALRKGERTPHREEVVPLIPLVSPFAPHIAEELWEQTGGTGSVFDSAWPQFDPSLAAEDSIELVVQVNGRVRSRITVDRDITEEAAVVAALADPVVAKFVAGAPKKIIFVPGRLLNIVA
jgi:leucyl-tRNA synthetase